MRLNKQLARIATNELLSILRRHPEGLRTSQLVGTPWFHGHINLTPRQVARLLRASGVVDHCYEGAGAWAASVWRLP
jgi:hypothetical protein